MITAALTTDFEYADEVLNSSPEMRERVLADRAMQVVSIEKALAGSPKNLVARVWMDGAPVGCFLAFAVRPEVMDIHTLLLPPCRGRRAVEAGKKVAALLFESGVRRLVGTCPSHVPEVQFFARAVGFRFVDRAVADWTFRGRPVGCIFMKLDPEDLCQ